MKKFILCLILILCVESINAQEIQSGNYNTTGHVKIDGTIQDSNYNTVGYFKSDGTIQDKNYKSLRYIKENGTVQNRS